MAIHNQRAHLHAAPPFLDVRLGLGAEAAMDILLRLILVRRMLCNNWSNSCSWAAI